MKESTVAIVQRELVHYRVPFYERLRALLRERGTELRLLYGRPPANDGWRHDTVDVPWATPIDNREVRVAGQSLMWQQGLPHLRGCDLIVVEQASRLLLNYVLLARQSLRLGPRVAYWGHGRNFKTYEASAAGEALKRFTSRRVHWWFAYNELSTDIITSLGYPSTRVTTVWNAIDTTRLSAWYDAVTHDELAQLRHVHGIKGQRVGLYVGSMYREKRLPFLLEAAVHLRESMPDFELVLVGAGEDEQVARDADAHHPWVHYVGPKFGRERAPYFALADVVLQPGIVGLGILDCLACRTPMITTTVDGHGPEIAYLKHEENGIIVPAWDDALAYADAAAALLRDDERMARLRENCRETSTRYSIEDMAARFADGISAALTEPA